MFKIFFNDRQLILSDNWNSCAADVNAISYKVIKNSEIKELVARFLENQQLRCLHLVAENATNLFNEVSRLFEQLGAAGGLVQNTSGEILMIFRNNHWDLPKGRCEANERSEETALREVEEECGIGGLQLFHSLITTYHIYRDTYNPNGNLVMKRTCWYLMKYEGNQKPIPQTVEGIERAEWIPQSQISTILPTLYNSIREVLFVAGVI